MYPMWLGKNPCFSLLGLMNVHLEHAKNEFPLLVSVTLQG